MYVHLITHVRTTRLCRESMTDIYYEKPKESRELSIIQPIYGQKGSKKKLINFSYSRKE